MQAGKGLIDPRRLWDGDRRAFLIHAYAHSRCGIQHQLRVQSEGGGRFAAVGRGQVVCHHPQRHPTLEGPKFLRRDGWYYILAPAALC